MRFTDDVIAAAILDLVHQRGGHKTACPSEVAKTLSAEWRALMPDVRRVAGALAQDGQIAVTQKGAPVDAETARGPIRLGLPRG